MTANDNVPPEPTLRDAAAALDDNRPDVAERLLRAFLDSHPDDPNALKMLAEVAIRFDCLQDAEGLLERCVQVAPAFVAARYRYAALLLRLNKPHRAIAELDSILQSDPENFECLHLRAPALARVGDIEAALAGHAELLRTHSERSGVWLNYAADLKSAGRQHESIALYKGALERFPGLVEAYWSLGNLKTYRFEDRDLAAMRAMLERTDIGDRERCLLHFTLGKAAEDASDFAGSFDHYAKANALQRAALRYDADHTTQLFAQLRATFSPELLARHTGGGCQARDPIFIVGLARSGSTLIEQILACHSQIEATMELPNVAAIIERLDGPYPQVLRELDGDVFEALGEEYIEDTRVFRKLGRAHFIDKMPENFRHLGLIRLMLPNARIVDARRHPLACGFSNLRQDFESDYAYSYDLTDIGRYYGDYVRLMDHFDRVLPGKVHRVFHERLIDDPEGEIRRLLDYLQLPFEEACLRFHENGRPVRTASSEQVRRPIFRDALEQWRNYEEWLGPLKKALGPVLDSYPAVPDFAAGEGRR